MDRRGRKILSWRLSNTLESDFFVKALHEAISRYGKPEIFKTDQGAQFASIRVIQVIKDPDIGISIDGRDRCQGNIFVERPWCTKRSLPVPAFIQLQFGAARRLERLDTLLQPKRGHSSLDHRIPDEVFIIYFIRSQRLPDASQKY